MEKIDFKQIKEKHLTYQKSFFPKKKNIFFKYYKVTGVSLLGLYMLYLYNDIKKIDLYEKDYITYFKHNSHLNEILLDGHKKMIPDYLNMKDYYIKDRSKGILDERYKLLSKAEGDILETCCGVFPNSICYKKEKIKHLYGIDWCNDLLELAGLTSKSFNKKVEFLTMDACKMDFDDDVFDTVVDTFGLQSSYNPNKQWSEMKRVCKKGGRILLLEFGKSYWLSTNYKIIKNAMKHLQDSGETIHLDWDQLIASDPEVKVIKRRRKINGRLYYYELEKI